MSTVIFVGIVRPSTIHNSLKASRVTMYRDSDRGEVLIAYTVESGDSKINRFPASTEVAHLEMMMSICWAYQLVEFPRTDHRRLAEVIRNLHQTAYQSLRSYVEKIAVVHPGGS